MYYKKIAKARKINNESKSGGAASTSRRDPKRKRLKRKKCSEERNRYRESKKGMPISSSQLVPVSSRGSDRQLPQELTLTQVPDFSIDEVSQSFEVETALGSRAHEKIPPDARSSNRIVDAKLHGSMESDHFLNKRFRARVRCIRPCNANSKPPAKRLNNA
jgi:hypothetical protein